MELNKKKSVLIKHFASSRHTQGKACFDDEHTQDDLRIQLAAAIHAGEPFVNNIYLMQGEGDLSYHAYQRLQEVLAAVVHAYYIPKCCSAVAKDLAQAINRGAAKAAVTLKQNRAIIIR